MLWKKRFSRTSSRSSSVGLSASKRSQLSRSRSRLLAVMRAAGAAGRVALEQRAQQVQVLEILGVCALTVAPRFGSR